MKKVVCIVIMLMLVFVIGCGETKSEKLPVPPKLDSSAPIGQAYMATNENLESIYGSICKSRVCIPSQNSGSGKVSINDNNPYVITASQSGGKIDFKLSVDADAIYSIAYLFSADPESGNYFKQFNLQTAGANQHPDSNPNVALYYSRNTAGQPLVAEFNKDAITTGKMLDSSYLLESQLFEGKNILLTFFCMESNGEFDCNDGKWVPVTFNVEVGRVDLSVGQPALALAGTNKFLAGQKQTFTYPVKNNGASSSGIFNYEWLVDGVSKSSGTVTSLAGGESKDLSYEFDIPTSSDKVYSLELKVDSDNSIDEAKETDNSYVFDFTAVECFNDRCWKGGTSSLQKCNNNHYEKLATPCKFTEACYEGLCIPEGDFLSKSLIGEWKLNDGTGTTAKGKVSAHSGTLKNGATWVSDAKFGTVLELDGVDDSVSIPNDFNGLGTTYTVTAWFNPMASTGGIFSANGDSLIAFAGEKQLIAVGYSSRGSDWGSYAVWGKTPLVYGTWYHVAFVVNEGSLQIYMNGKFDNSAQKTAKISNVASTTSSIGSNQMGWVPKPYFMGRIANVRVYDSPLSDDQVLSDFKLAGS